jgi:hypothetical protein
MIALTHGAVELARGVWEVEGREAGARRWFGDPGVRSCGRGQATAGGQALADSRARRE